MGLKTIGIRNTTTEFGLLARALHWLVAVGIFVLLYLGIQQSGLESGPEKTEIRAIHGSVALTVFFLMSIRITWRWMNDIPAHPGGTPAWSRMVAKIVHLGLYVVVFTQLLAGAMVVATGGKALPFFGLFSIPLPVAENHDRHEWFEGIHEFTWKPLAALLVIHVLGALYNHFVAKNDVVRRMTFGSRSD